jgi:hypothetical protein
MCKVETKAFHMYMCSTFASWTHVYGIIKLFFKIFIPTNRILLMKFQHSPLQKKIVI